MSGLLSGVLPAVFSAGDKAKRIAKQLLSDPVAVMQQAAGNIQDEANQQSGLMSQAFSNPQRPLQITDPQAFNQASNRMFTGLMSIAPAGIITPQTAEMLKAMTREQFLGNPKIVGKSDAIDLKPREINSLIGQQTVPFLGGKFEAKYSPEGAVVLDKGKPIASYNFGDTLVVDPKYRGQGIGEELVYQQRTSFPDVAQAKTRNKISQKIQENVWDRIQEDLKK